MRHWLTPNGTYELEINIRKMQPTENYGQIDTFSPVTESLD